MIVPRNLNNSYDEKVDLWSLGVLTYGFSLARHYLKTPLVMTTRRIARGDMKIPSFISAKAADLIKTVSISIFVGIGLETNMI